MLTAEVRTNIDKKWAACWPTSSLRPLVLLDLLSYLFFIKKLEEKQSLAGTQPQKPGTRVNFPGEKNDLSWKCFKDLDPQSMLMLFTKEKGIPYQLKNYNHSDFKYSLFMREPLLLTPTARILINVVDIIKIMEAEDIDTCASVFEYLLNKAEILAPNGQVFAPDHIVKLMVAMVRPAREDIIVDPSAGNGSFLVNSAAYVVKKTPPSVSNFTTEIVADRYRGIESDPILLRIAAMNMVLHGIDDPQLEGLNVLDNSKLNLRQQPTVILSNLFFRDAEEKIIAAEDTLQTKNKRPEISLLNLIVKNLESRGRAGIIIRETILLDNTPAIKTIRQSIINEHKLEAVISLPAVPDSLFSGACILIFTKAGAGTTDKVWFYKMDQAKKIGEKDVDPPDPFDTEEHSFENQNIELSDVLSRWDPERKNLAGDETDKSFFVPVDDIKNNNYNLKFSQYKKITKEGAGNQHKPFRENKKTIILRARARRRQMITQISLSVLITGGFAFYIVYFRNNYPVSFYAATKYELPLNSSNRAKDNKTPVTKSPGEIQGINKSGPKDLYTIPVKAYFYSVPSESARRAVYINHGNNVVLRPIDEKNGFIYIVYTNRRGETIRGWLNKKDLKPLQY